MTTRATELGAAGLLVPREVDEAGWMAKMLVGRPETPLPVLSVRTDLNAAMKAGGEVVASVPLPTVAVTGTNVHGVSRHRRTGGVGAAGRALRRG